MLMRLQHKRPDGEMDTYHLKPGRKYHFGRGSTCEIRILDLKLSRKHCLIECIDGDWQVEDLGSTNGAKLNGQLLANSRSLRAGSVIEAGSTNLTIAGFIDPEADEDADPVMPEQLDMADDPEDPASKVAAAESTLVANEWDPHEHAHASTGALQPLSNGAPAAPKPAPQRPALGLDDDLPSGNTTIMPSSSLGDTAPLTPKSQTPPAVPTMAAKPAPSKPAVEMPPPAPTRPAKIKPVTIRVGRIDGDDQHPTAPEASAPETAVAPVTTPTVVASNPAPGPVKPVVIQSGSSEASDGKPSTEAVERTFYITVLGRRIGPLTRSDARDLKSRELKGILTPADLESYPQA